MPAKKRTAKRPIKRKEKKVKHKLKHFLSLAGVYTETEVINSYILTVSVFMGIIEIVYMYYYFLTMGSQFLYPTIMAIIVTPFVVGLFYLIIWLVYYFYLDMRIYQRKKGIEEVFPDFLLLTSSNIRAGLPIDQSLWYAVRPRFGVLSNEIQMVAKETMSGEDLSGALRGFANKYDSPLVKRSISLLLVGMEAGGEIGTLLDNIALDIQESRITRKEMAASVTTYVIFISFAAVGAAPLLFGLAEQLLSVVSHIVGSMDFESGGMGGSMGFSPSANSITAGDFKIFAISMLSITSLISAMIIATIQKGSVRDGIKYIPIFIMTSVFLFLLASWGFSKMLSGLSI